METPNNSGYSKVLLTIGVISELIAGILGLYGLGHIINKRWKIGIGFLLFSFFWLFLEGVYKDIVLGGVYPPGTVGLFFHIPITCISIYLLIRMRRSKSKKQSVI